jgi:hypothetical protein
MTAGHKSWENSRANSRLSTLINSHATLVLAGPPDIRVEKTLMQTLASQLSSTLMQLLFSLDRDMHESWENSHANSRLSTLINSHATLVLAWPGHESWENKEKWSNFCRTHEKVKLVKKYFSRKTCLSVEGLRYFVQRILIFKEKRLRSQHG